MCWVYFENENPTMRQLPDRFHWAKVNLISRNSTRYKKNWDNQKRACFPVPEDYMPIPVKTNKENSSDKGSEGVKIVCHSASFADSFVQILSFVNS
jgi:hypothetical protein